MTTPRFDEFSLRPELLRALERKGFENPMPVQVRILEDDTLLDGDLIVQARTGSGKTLAFALPLLQKMERGERAPQVLVLSPTRELAQQTAREFQWVGGEMGIRPASLVGGMDMDRQIRSLRDGAAVVVGTPGRVLDHLRRGTLRPEGIQSLILDEGDHMLDLGFRDELESIMSALGTVERTWLFSATMPEDVVTLARKYLNAPRKISLVTDAARHEDIAQRAYVIPSRRRFEGLANVLLCEHPKRALLFCATRMETQELAERLGDEGFRAMALHGDMTQRERNNALESFRRGRVDLLVATDVAARGLDIDGLSHVIQYGLPGCLETFIHRSGRTGRAGHEGRNVILLTAREARQFKSLVSHTALDIEWLPAPDASEVEGISRAEFEKTLLESPEDEEAYREWAQQLLQREDTEELLAGLLARAFGSQARGYAIREDVEAEMAREQNRRYDPRPTGRGSDRPLRKLLDGAVTMKFAQGRQDGWEVGALLGALCRGLGVRREDVGNIRLRDHCAFVELSPHAAAQLEGRRERLAREGLNGAQEADALPPRPRRDGARPARTRR